MWGEKKKGGGKIGKKKDKKDGTQDKRHVVLSFFFLLRCTAQNKKSWEHQKAQLAVSHRPDILLRLSCSWTGVAKDCSGQAGQKTAQSLCSENHCRQNLLGLTSIEIILATESSNSEKIAHRGNTLP